MGIDAFIDASGHQADVGLGSLMDNSIPMKQGNQTRSNTIWKKLAWFAGIWIFSVLALAIVAYGIKLLLR